MVHSPNQLLAAMPDELFKAMQPHLRSIELKRGDVVAAPGGVVRHVIFPHSGIVSLVVELSIGEMVETAMIGRDEVVNAVCALDGKISLNKGIVQLEGEASVILPERLNAIADQNAPLRSLLLRHEQVLFAQAQQSAACNASHFVEARMCRWLLRNSRSGRLGRLVYHPGIPGSDARRSADECVACRQYPAKGRFYSLPARSCAYLGRRSADRGSMRMLRNAERSFRLAAKGNEFLRKIISMLRAVHRLVDWPVSLRTLGQSSTLS